MRRSLGRPGAEPEKLEKAKKLLAQGAGILKMAKMVGLGTGTVHKLKREMAGVGYVGVTRRK